MEVFTLDKIIDAIEKLKEDSFYKRYFYYFTAGTGIPDKIAIDHFKDYSNVIVFTRDGKVYRKGKRYEIKIDNEMNFDFDEW